MAKYTDDERRAAVALMKQVGLRPAARHLGITTGTIARWASPELAARERAAARLRKPRYEGRCECTNEHCLHGDVCGAPTSGARGRSQAPKLCRECFDTIRHFTYKGVPVAVLRHLYVDQGLTLAEIAERVSGTKGGVAMAMRNHSIQLRPRGRRRRVASTTGHP
jgi:hypothetical protein